MSGTKIIWTISAKIELRQIFQYYKDTANISVAQKMVITIKQSTNIIKTHPEVGQEEETLKQLREGHRYLLKGNYKLIYRLIGNTIYITDVFDTRQNPKKLVKRNK